MTATLMGGVLPIFLIIGLGSALMRAEFLDDATKTGMNRLVYFVCLPLLLFEKTAAAAELTGRFGGLLALVVIGTLVGIAAAYGVAAMLRLRGHAIGAFVQAGFRGNLVFVALPIVLYTIRVMPMPERAAMETVTVLVIVPVIILYNVIGVLVLVLHGAPACPSRHPVAGAVLGIARNPLIIACVAGLAVRLTGVRVPALVLRTCDIMGAAAFPLALICVGCELAISRFATMRTAALACAAVKVLLLPAVGAVLAPWLGLDAWSARIGLLLLASPTAVASYVLTREMGGDAVLAANAIAASTLLSIVSFSVLALLPV